MSEKVREVFLEVIFKLTVERGGACQTGKARTAECIPSLFVCLFVPASFQEGLKVVQYQAFTAGMAGDEIAGWAGNTSSGALNLMLMSMNFIL